MSDVSVQIEGEEISLADLAGLNMGDVEAKRRVPLPKGMSALWKCSEAKLEVLGAGANAKPCISIESEVQHVYGETETVNNETMVGKKHTERFFLSGQSALEALGYAKAFMEDAGFEGEGKLQDVLAAFQGTMYKGKISHRNNPNDDENPFVNLTKLKPYIPEEEEAAAE